MSVVWIALAAIGAYELWAALTGHLTWSQLIHGSLKGHPVRQVIVFGLVVLIAAHVIFGLFNRHKHPKPSPAMAYEDYRP